MITTATRRSSTFLPSNIATPRAVDQSYARKYYWRLHDHKFSWTYRRFSRQILYVSEQNDSVKNQRLALEVVALVESLERGVAWRFIEWCVWCLRRDSVTCGPLQLRSAPASLQKSIIEGADRLMEATEKRRSSRDFDEWLSRVWNGSSRKQPGAAISYTHAVRLARAALLCACGACKTLQPLRRGGTGRQAACPPRPRVARP
jgi:hypothetical protein